MSDYGGSRYSSPSSVHSAGSSAATTTGAEASDRLLRSECRRQGGKHCGHVECQVRSYLSRPGAAEHQNPHEHDYEPHSASPMSMSPAQPVAVTAYRRSTRLEAHSSSARITTTRRVVRSSLLDSAPSSSGGLSSSGLRGRLKFSSNNSNKSRQADDDVNDDEAIEKGALDAHLSMKENFVTNNFDTEIFEQQWPANNEQNFARGGRLGGIAMATRTLFSRILCSILWAVSSVCTIARSGLVHSVSMTTSVLWNSFSFFSAIASKSWLGVRTIVVMTIVGGVSKIAQLLAHVAQSASVLNSFVKSVAVLTYGALSSVAHAAYLPVAAVRAVAMATCRQASNGFRSVSQVFIVNNNNVRRRKRTCLCLLLLILLPLLLLLLAGSLGYVALPSNRAGLQLASSGEALRTAGSQLATSAGSACNYGVSAVSWLLLWLNNATATASNAATRLVSSWSSTKSPSAPTIATTSSAPAGCCRADLSALELQVAALRTAMTSLEQKSLRPPEPQLPPPPLPPPPLPPSPPAVSAEALAKTEKDLANLSAKLDSLEQRLVKFSLEMRKVGDAATAAAVAAASDAVARSSADSSKSLSEISQRVTLLASRLEAEAERQKQRTAEAVAAVADKEGKTVAELQARLSQLELSIATLTTQLSYFSRMTAASSTTTTATTEVVLADRMPDFALHSAGGYAISTRCTSAYTAKSSYFHLFGLPVFSYINGPNVALQPGLQLGECWPFVGFPGHLLVKLAARARISHVTIDHVPRSQTYNGAAASAPRQFSVYGLNSERAEFSQAKLLGSFVYNADNGTSSQTFQLTHNENTSAAYPCVELVILSNHGAEHTCLYRFRVHGSLV